MWTGRYSDLDSVLIGPCWSQVAQCPLVDTRRPRRLASARGAHCLPGAAPAPASRRCRNVSC